MKKIYFIMLLVLLLSGISSAQLRDVTVRYDSVISDSIDNRYDSNVILSEWNNRDDNIVFLNITAMTVGSHIYVSAENFCNNEKVSGHFITANDTGSYELGYGHSAINSLCTTKITHLVSGRASYEIKIISYPQGTKEVIR